MNLGNWVKKRRSALQAAYYGKFGQAVTPQRWVFVVGCYNSGTTLLHDVLACHPDVAHLPREGQYCTDQLTNPGDAGLARAWALEPELFCLNATVKAPPDADRVKRQWSAMMEPTGRGTFLEKSIPNAARIPWLEHHFENAHFIGIVRNGYVVTEGIMRKGARSAEQAAEQWALSNEIMLKDLRFVKHSHLLTYEEFTGNPQKTIRKVLEFLELSPMETIDGKKIWQVHGQESEIMNMNDDSLAKLSTRSKAIVEQKGEPLLAQFGYLAPRLEAQHR